MRKRSKRSLSNASSVTAKGSAVYDSHPCKAYAIVTSCDGSGAFKVYGVHPNKNGTLAVYNLVIALVEGIRDGYVLPNMSTDLIERIPDGDLTVKVSVWDALALFVDPAIKRTRGPVYEDAVPSIRWFERFREPDPHNLENFLLAFLSKKKLMRIQEHDVLGRSEDWRATEEYSNTVDGHREQFVEHFASKKFYQGWFLNEGELVEIGFNEDGSIKELISSWVNCNRLVQRGVQMLSHMRLLYTLSEKSKVAELWNKEIEIAVNHEAFIDCGMVFCVGNKTIRAREDLAQARAAGSSSPLNIRSPASTKMRFFRDSSMEQKALVVFQGLSILFMFQRRQPSSLIDKSVFVDLLCSIHNFLQNGVGDVIKSTRLLLPGNHDLIPEDTTSGIADVLYTYFVKWHLSYLGECPSPLSLTSDDTLQELEEDIAKVLMASPAITGMAIPKMSRCIATGFWDLFLMALDEGGCIHTQDATRPATPRLREASNIKQTLRYLILAFCSLPVWYRRFVEAEFDLIKKCLSIDRIIPSEKRAFYKDFCPMYFVLKNNNTIVPSETFLNGLKESSDFVSYLRKLFTRMAARCPTVTLDILRGVADLGDKLAEEMERAQTKIDKKYASSTTRSMKRCNHCGVEDEHKTFPTCANCKVARYCSVDCQRANWKHHKKVCIPSVNATSSDVDSGLRIWQPPSAVLFRERPGWDLNQ